MLVSGRDKVVGKGKGCFNYGFRNNGGSQWGVAVSFFLGEKCGSGAHTSGKDKVFSKRVRGLVGVQEH